MSFREAPWRLRYLAMGDQAEMVFEATYPECFVRYGLNRPPINLSGVPAFVRYSPDYLTNKGFVEVQGFGNDQTAKFKLEKLRALAEWHQQFRVDFFLWDSSNKRYGWVRLHELEAGLGAHHVRRFPEGNQYFAVPADELPLADKGWTAWS